jgi:hypothetical protein
MKTFTVEHNVEMPDRKRSLYPFKVMNIGDSFAVTKAGRPALSAAATKYKKDNPEFNFTIRKCDEYLYRIWRINND